MDKLAERQAELIKIIEAISGLLKNEDWLLFEGMVCKGLTERLERQLLSEAKNPTPNLENMYRLQGQLTWANRYSDLKGYAHTLVKELEGIKQKIK